MKCQKCISLYFYSGLDISERHFDAPCTVMRYFRCFNAVHNFCNNAKYTSAFAIFSCATWKVRSFMTLCISVTLKKNWQTLFNIHKHRRALSRLLVISNISCLSSCSQNTNSRTVPNFTLFIVKVTAPEKIMFEWLHAQYLREENDLSGTKSQCLVGGGCNVSGAF